MRFAGLEARIARELGIAPGQVQSALALLDEGATVPFLARYRKEATGGLDEVQLRAIEERAAYLQELEERRAAILASIQEQGKLDDALRARILAADTKQALEDLYLPYKPKRRTRATIARERGLEPLADLIWLGQANDQAVTAAAAAYVDPAGEVATVEDALRGARDILAERVAEDADIRAWVRAYTRRAGTIVSRGKKGIARAGSKYADYFEFTQKLADVPSHRILALRRGEAEEQIVWSIEVQVADVVNELARRVRTGRAAHGQLMIVVEDAYKRLLAPSIEGDVRLELEQRADDEAISIFGANLEQLLLGAPAGERVVLGLDPGFRTGVKTAVVSRTGALQATDTLYLHQEDRFAEHLRALIAQHAVELIAIGNGTASRETETLVRGIVRELPEPRPQVIVVNEAGASVYSASDLARAEFPDLDVSLRGAPSIARRLQDPLAELVKIDPKSIGVGQYQHDVSQTRLKKRLDTVVEICVNRVGVEVNTASVPLLSYVAGVGETLARNIVALRDQRGGIKSRKELLEVPRLGARAFEQAAGFLRVRGAANPLDATAVHPERYALVERMARDLGVKVADLIANDAVIDRIELQRYVSDDVGLPTLHDIIAELRKPGRDPRESFEPPAFRDDLREPKDLQPGMQLEGVVTNLVAFGAFVDVGVHQDGLVHVSQLADRFVKDPADVVRVGQKVNVTVLSIDLARNRIALSMKKQKSPAAPRREEKPTSSPRPAKGSISGNGMRFSGLVLALAVAAAITPAEAQRSAHVPTPVSVLGFEPGADYQLASFGQIADYFTRLAQASDRIRIDTIGRTVRGRPLILAYISSPDNLRQLEKYRLISERLAHARNLTDADARVLAREGKAVVWVDAGIHGDEVAPPQHMPLLAYRLATDESDDARRIRDQVIALIMPVINPDGADIVADWYTKIVRTPFESAPLPVLYHHYVGVDLNRDWYMYTQPETRAVGHILYHRWFPQITYNQHQSPPYPARIFVPPFAEPVNPNIPPGVTRGTNLVGAAMAKRFEDAGMSGVVSRVAFDMWWNGGVRSAAYYHNMIALLTETAQNTWANPRYYPADSFPQFLGGTTVSSRQPSVFYANPWKGGWWRLRDAVEYNYTAALAVLDIGAKLKEDWLFGIYRLGREAIEKGKNEAPFAYIIPLEQWDRTEALELVRLLRLAGLEVHRATEPFQAGVASYPAGSYIAYASQAFRPYLVDVLEKQVYPDLRPYPGAPPQPPYDLAGWTLPIQMGVTVKRVDAAFTARAEVVDVVPDAAGRVVGTGSAAFLLSHRDNASATAVNRLMATGEVAWATAPFTVAGASWDAGTFVISGVPRAHVEEFARELGVEFFGLEAAPRVATQLVRAPNVALYKSWVGDWIVKNGQWSWIANIGEGWTRWVLERHEFAYDTLHDADIRAGDLSRHDVLILPEQEPDVILNGHAPGTMPPAYTGGIGTAGAERIRRFVEAGGRLIAIDAAAGFAIDLFDLPVRDAVKDIPANQFFVPGSLLRITLDTQHPLAYGMPAEGVAFFVRSRAFEVTPGAPVTVVARYPENGLLLSGWALGEREALGGKAAVLEARVGKGSVVLIGFRPLFRGQPRNTFKLLFNAIHAQ